MHYCVDKWLEKYYPQVKMVRYADDLIVHCRSYEEAAHTLTVLKERLTECGLTAHPEKTKIVYCKKMVETSEDIPSSSISWASAFNH